MGQPRLKPATYADLEALPDTIVGEIVFGALYAHPRPTPRHSRAHGELQTEITVPFGRGRGGPGGWIFLVEPELHLGEHVVVPDIAGWRRERLTPFPDTPFVETPPDWVAEILSPSTAQLDRTDKRTVYAKFRVKHLWYVDPAAKTLEVFSLREDGLWLIAATFKDADPVTAPPFEVHTFPLDNLWVPSELEHPAVDEESG